MKWLVATLFFKSVYFSNNYKGKMYKQNKAHCTSPVTGSPQRHQVCSTNAGTRDCTWLIKGKCVTVPYADKQMNMKILYRD
jgi:hypothetical protein